MNRLKNSRVYLSGSMDRVVGGGIQWRQDLKPWLKQHGVICIDPCNKPKCILGNAPIETPKVREEANRFKESGQYDKFKEFIRPIRNVDLRFTDMADYLIVNLNLDESPCGTYNEIFIAVQQKKPVIIRCEQGKVGVPSWLFGCIPHQLFFNTWDEVKEYLRHVDEDENVDPLGRWFLFDFDEEIKQT